MSEVIRVKDDRYYQKLCREGSVGCTILSDLDGKEVAVISEALHLIGLRAAGGFRAIPEHRELATNVLERFFSESSKRILDIAILGVAGLAEYQEKVDLIKNARKKSRGFWRFPALTFTVVDRREILKIELQGAFPPPKMELKDLESVDGCQSLRQKTGGYDITMAHLTPDFTHSNPLALARNCLLLTREKGVLAVVTQREDVVACLLERASLLAPISTQKDLLFNKQDTHCLILRPRRKET